MQYIGKLPTDFNTLSSFPWTTNKIIQFQAEIKRNKIFRLNDNGSTYSGKYASFAQIENAGATVISLLDGIIQMYWKLKVRLDSTSIESELSKLNIE